MLTLTRNRGQRIFINDDIIIEVRAVKGQQVKLSIQAPKEYKIMREELLIKEQQVEDNHVGRQ